tara:strand:- start:3276 stop:3695 length:420 start_codon:yes stop_codon:yes gene_type:complete
MKYLILALALTGCGGGSSESKEPKTLPPVIEQPAVKCMTVNITHVPTNVNDWVYINGLYSLNFSGDIAEQRLEFKGTDSSANQLKYKDSMTTDFYSNDGYLFTLAINYGAFSNVTVNISELHGAIAQYSYKLNDKECKL